MGARFPTVPWGLVDVLLGILIVGSGTALIRVLLLDSAIDLGGPRAPITAAAIFLVEGLLLLAVFLLAVARHRASWHTLGVKADASPGGYWLAVAVLAGSLISNAIYFAAVSAAGWRDLQPTGLPDGLIGEGIYRMVNTFSVGLWGPFAEEAFFRGFVLPALAPRFGIWGALVGSSLLFSVSHGSIATALPIFVSGMLLAWLYLRTGSLWPCVAAHGAQNLLALAFSGTV